MRKFWKFLLPALLAGPAWSATFNVQVAFDLPDANPGDGNCAAVGFPPSPPYSIPPGLCTLRAAIQEANSDAVSDTVNLPGGLVYSLGAPYPGLGPLEINSSMVVTQQLFDTAPRPVINANGRPGAIRIQSGNVNLNFLDITGGSATIPESSAGGGVGVAFGAGQVQLAFVRIFGNQAGSGGGLYNDGPNTTLFYSEVFDNERIDGFGGANAGAGIFNRGTLTIEHSAVFGNSGSAAIDSRPPFVGEPVLNILNSTIAENDGAGVRQVTEGILTIRNSTIARNTIGLHVAGTGGTGGSLFLRVSAIADNQDFDCSLSPAAVLNLNRYNLDSDDSCELAAGSSNLAGVDARLTGLLRRDGEFTHTMWPLPDSPMIDGGHPTIGSIGCLAEDQRGVDRPVDYDGDDVSRCDIGAVEMQPGESGDYLFQDRFEQ